ncbi:hypothetical protein Dsin_031067 [Dipteronia sinensis]|uniref:RNase H type-1 domain-containing protein n=1 Tax=Dipteronia sinensis TaxID=43782 RepID=A0AAE0DRR9_9ROSI|nr:hypothetical protein Dsin_031067 [Dipteronia sinensis]
MSQWEGSRPEGYYPKCGSIVTKVWQPPTDGSLKFNVDRSARGCPGMAGMGGVLRNHYGRALDHFSIHMGIQDSNLAEILGFHKARQWCVTNPVLQSVEVIIVSDSMVAISWINDVGFGSLKHVRTIYDIRNMTSFHGNLKIIHNHRASNSFADMLAKRGSNNEGDLMYMGG